METKELKIQVPEGYEIDKENSTFECVKFKPIKKAVSYEEVAKELFYNKNAYFLNERGEIINSPLGFSLDAITDSSNFTSVKQIQKVLSINLLLNVAKYLNGKDWKPDWDNEEREKYYIYRQNEGFKIDYVYSYTTMNIYFKSEEAAQQAIDILGEETIRLALSTDW